jgi:hypothetical protein
MQYIIYSIMSKNFHNLQMNIFNCYRANLNEDPIKYIFTKTNNACAFRKVYISKQKIKNIYGDQYF